jgi:hypothetical protein
MTPSAPRDPNQLAKSIIDIATGETKDRAPSPQRTVRSGDMVDRCSETSWTLSGLQSRGRRSRL